jgi:membrane fusion protein, heavy metal efflux system
MKNTNWKSLPIKIGLSAFTLMFFQTAIAADPNDADPQAASQHDTREHDDHAAHHDEHVHDAHEDRHDHDHGHGHDHGQGHETKPTAFTDELLKRSGIILEKPRKQQINIGIKLSGRILADEDRVVHVIARFPGIIKQVNKKLGDPVAKGTPLAVIESNQSLQPYEITSLIGGTVVKRHASVGEFVAESAEIFVVADLSRVLVDLFVFEPDFGRVKIGQRVEIAAPHLQETYTATINFVSALVEPSTQSKFVRAEIDNTNGDFYPGQFVNGTLLLEQVEVPLAIRSTALVQLEGRDTVFVRHGEQFEAESVRVGRRDSDWIEILDGLDAEISYAFGNTFLIKAELGKGEAGHEH